MATVAAEATGRQVKQQNVSWWLKKSGGKVPPEFAPAIAKACQDKDPSTKVTREALCPGFPWGQIAVTPKERVA